MNAVPYRALLISCLNDLRDLGKVKYCTIENHLYLKLALCV